MSLEISYKLLENNAKNVESMKKISDTLTKKAYVKLPSEMSDLALGSAINKAKDPQRRGQLEAEQRRRQSKKGKVKRGIKKVGSKVKRRGREALDIAKTRGKKKRQEKRERIVEGRKERKVEGKKRKKEEGVQRTARKQRVKREKHVYRTGVKRSKKQPSKWSAGDEHQLREFEQLKQETGSTPKKHQAEYTRLKEKKSRTGATKKKEEQKKRRVKAFGREASAWMARHERTDRMEKMEEQAEAKREEEIQELTDKRDELADIMGTMEGERKNKIKSIVDGLNADIRNVQNKAELEKRKTAGKLKGAIGEAVSQVQRKKEKEKEKEQKRKEQDMVSTMQDMMKDVEDDPQALQTLNTAIDSVSSSADRRRKEIRLDRSLIGEKREIDTKNQQIKDSIKAINRIPDLTDAQKKAIKDSILKKRVNKNEYEAARRAGTVSSVSDFRNKAKNEIKNKRLADMDSDVLRNISTKQRDELASGNLQYASGSKVRDTPKLDQRILRGNIITDKPGFDTIVNRGIANPFGREANILRAELNTIQDPNSPLYYLGRGMSNAEITGYENMLKPPKQQTKRAGSSPDFTQNEAKRAEGRSEQDKEKFTDFDNPNDLGYEVSDADDEKSVLNIGIVTKSLEDTLVSAKAMMSIHSPPIDRATELSALLKKSMEVLKET